MSQAQKRHVIGYFDSDTSLDFKVYHKVASVLRDDCAFHVAIGSVVAIVAHVIAAVAAIVVLSCCSSRCYSSLVVIVVVVVVVVVVVIVIVLIVVCHKVICVLRDVCIFHVVIKAVLALSLSFCYFSVRFCLGIVFKLQTI